MRRRQLILALSAGLILLSEAKGQWVVNEDGRRTGQVLDDTDPLGLKRPPILSFVPGAMGEGMIEWEGSLDGISSSSSLFDFSVVYDYVRAELSAQAAALEFVLDPNTPETNAILRKFKIGSRGLLLGLREPAKAPRTMVEPLSRMRSHARATLRLRTSWRSLVLKILSLDQQLALARHLDSPEAEFRFCLSMSVATMGLGVGLERSRIDSLESLIVDTLKRIDAEAHVSRFSDRFFDGSSKTDAEMRIRNLSDGMLARVLNPDELNRWNELKDQYLASDWSLFAFPSTPVQSVNEPSDPK